MQQELRNWSYKALRQVLQSEIYIERNITLFPQGSICLYFGKQEDRQCNVM